MSVALPEGIAYDLVTPSIKKGLFSAAHVPFRRYLGLYQEAFEIGVVYGVYTGIVNSNKYLVVGNRETWNFFKLKIASIAVFVNAYRFPCDLQGRTAGHKNGIGVEACPRRCSDASPANRELPHA